MQTETYSPPEETPMAQTVEEMTTNGEVSVPRPGRPPRGGKPLPDETTITLDGETRLLLEEWVSWYYPTGRVNNSTVAQEMISLAHTIGAEDNSRAETPEQRRERLRRGGS